MWVRFLKNLELQNFDEKADLRDSEVAQLMPLVIISVHNFALFDHRFGLSNQLLNNLFLIKRLA